LKGKTTDALTRRVKRAKAGCLPEQDRGSTGNLGKGGAVQGKTEKLRNDVEKGGQSGGARNINAKIENAALERGK